MKKLNDILSGVKVISRWDGDDIVITGITADSREVKPGFIFIAVKGTTSDGHDYAVRALENGAVAVIVDQSMPQLEGKHCIRVNDSAEALGKIAHHFYNDPTKHIKLIGITGTNGKTTTATLCFDLVEKLGYRCGLISTVENRIHDRIIPATHTTPDPVQLSALLAAMVDDGCDYAFMEVSSHAAHQKRIAGLHFYGGVFTNITHDHLDYHHTFDQYIAAKKLFFDGLTKDAFALVNADDKRSSVMLQNCNAKKYTYSVKGPADFTARIIENNVSGLVLQMDGEEVHAQLPGEFNASNLLCVYSIARICRFEKNEILRELSALKPITGRFDVVFSAIDRLTGIIDYAHTPDAVEKLLSTVRSMLKKEQHLITVIGCGGDRDKTKRPLMAKVAASISDKAVFTSDNPRSEDPDQILHEMEAGISENLRHKCISVTGRKEAIRTAVMLAQKNDVICVAGKGHEKYQEIKGVKYPFDDRQVLLETFKTQMR